MTSQFMVRKTLSNLGPCKLDPQTWCMIVPEEHCLDIDRNMKAGKSKTPDEQFKFNNHTSSNLVSVLVTVSLIKPENDVTLVWKYTGEPPPIKNILKLPLSPHLHQSEEPRAPNSFKRWESYSIEAERHKTAE